MEVVEFVGQVFKCTKFKSVFMAEPATTTLAVVSVVVVVVVVLTATCRRRRGN